MQAVHLILVALTGLALSCVTQPDNPVELQNEFKQLKLELDEANRLLKLSADQRRIESYKNDKLVDQNIGLEKSLYAISEYARASQDRLMKRNAILQGYIDHIKSTLDSGSLDVEIIDGRLYLRLPADILFASGSSDLSKVGKQELFDLAKILSSSPENSFQIEGHTDTDPITGGKFETNWHLGYARAMSVLNVFQSAGIDQERISAASFGEFKPRASNDIVEGKARNRRIEIVMLPDLTPLKEEAPKVGWMIP